VTLNGGFAERVDFRVGGAVLAPPGLAQRNAMDCAREGAEIGKSGTFPGGARHRPSDAKLGAIVLVAPVKISPRSSCAEIRGQRLLNAVALLRGWSDF
jgi:hypothetical protein